MRRKRSAAGEPAAAAMDAGMPAPGAEQLGAAAIAGLGDQAPGAGDVLARLAATTPEPASDPVQDAAASRPRLRLMRSEAAPQGQAAPEDQATPSETQRPAPASGVAQRLARATAGAIEYEDDGRVSVLFPPPGAVFGSSEMSIAREGAEPADAVPATSPPTEAPAAGAAAPPGAAAPLDRDELYADFMRRLRRDVLEQREQLGDL
jgi:hypothetical protein